MSRTEKIIAKVRRSLGDTKEPYRHTTSDLLDVLNDGMRHIAIKTLLFRGVDFIPLTRGQVTYDLPSDLIKLNKVLFEGEKLPLKTTTYMDEKVTLSWRSHTDEDKLECAVYDQEDVQEIQVYPRLLGDTLTDIYSIEPAVFGIDSEVTDFNTETFGLLSTLVDELENTETDVFGIISDVVQTKAIIVLYNRAPISISDISEDPEIPSFYDKALKHYITGHIYRDDVEKQNRQLGAEELALAEDLIDLIKARAETHRVSNSAHDTVYRGMG